MRVMVVPLIVLGLAAAAPAGALTLYNSQDPRSAPQTSRAAEALDLAISRLYEALAAVERHDFAAANRLKDEVGGQFRAAAGLFGEAASSASQERITPRPTSQAEAELIPRMMSYCSTYKLAKDCERLSEADIFTGAGNILRAFAEQVSSLDMASFASKDPRIRLRASDILLQAIRIQDLGRVTTAYLALSQR